MGFFSMLNPKNIKEKMEIDISLAKLELLARCMEEETDKETDLSHWQDNIIVLLQYSSKNDDYLMQTINAYQILYKLFLKKHHPELID